MSAAQALSSSLPPSGSGMRPSSGAATERADASFRDTLDAASRSGHGAETVRGGLPPDGAQGRKGLEGGASDEGRDGSASDGDGLQQRGEAGSVAELSVVLAQLGGLVAPEGGETDDAATTIRTAPTGVATALDEAGPRLPGQVTEGETLDAEQIRALLNPGATPLARSEDEATVIKATVTKQETHLAVASAPSGALAKLSGDDAVAAALGGAQSPAREDPLRPGRTPGGAVPGDAQSPGVAARDGVIAETWSGGAALSDQGIAGQDGRNPDGRGSSGAGAQQQGSAAFMSLLAGGVSQGAAAVEGSADASFGYDPVGDQIAAGVRGALKADAATDGSSDGVVKVLQLELKPANLGSVTVRLALKDNVISIHLEAQRLDTLAVIEREREALVGALASAGYTVDGVTAAPQSDLTRSASTFSAPGDASSSGPQGGLQGQAGQGQGLAGSSGGQGRPGDTGGAGSSLHRHPSDDKDAESRSIRRDAGGLYV